MVMMAIVVVIVTKSKSERKSSSEIMSFGIKVVGNKVVGIKVAGNIVYLHDPIRRSDRSRDTRSSVLTSPRFNARPGGPTPGTPAFTCTSRFVEKHVPSPWTAIPKKRNPIRWNGTLSETPGAGL